MKLADLSWRLKIPLALTAVIVLTEVVVTTALVSRALRDARGDLEASARNLGTLLARSLREPLLRDDLWQAFEVIRSPVAARSADNPLQDIVVLDAARQVYVASDPRRLRLATPAADLPAPLADLAARGQASEGFHFMFDGIDGGAGAGVELGAVWPIKAEDGTPLGTLLLAFDAALYQERVRRTLVELALVSLPGLLILVPLGWLAGKRLAEPLVQVAQALSRVGREPPVRIAEALPAAGADEIGRLSHQARAMLADLARKDALERQVIASERLAAVGRVSAAIAHEINNPLGGMLNAIDTAARHGRPDAVTLKTLGLLERGLQQIRATVSALLVEARLDSPRLTAQDWLDLHTLIEPQLSARTLRLLWQVDTAASPSWPLPAHEVRQLVLNLLLNATKAAQATAHEPATVELTVTDAPGLLAVVVGNTGPDIPADLLPRLFEPFVAATERGGQRSWGLGLWVCWQIVQRLHGSIEVQSEAGWTRFAVSLPLERPVAPADSAGSPTNRET
jgi:signal transduction histidine kinase